MNALASMWPALVAMLVLIVASALFSGGEAALFSMTPRARRGLRRLGLGGRIADGLLRDPERLLSAVLFWNLLINMTYFALAAMIGSRIQSGAAAIAVSLLPLLVIIFFSEMLPKSLALLSPQRAAAVLSPPLSIAVRVVGPILPPIMAANRIATRLVWPGLVDESELELEDIHRAIELGTDDAALATREREVLKHLVETADVRVGEWMRPRSHWRVLSEDADEATWLETLRAVLDADEDSSFLLVVNDRDVVTRAIAPRSLRPSQLDAPEEFAESVVYVPWSCRVSHAMDQLHGDDRDVAVVVDEFGEWIGALSINEILQRILSAEIGPQMDPPAENGTATVRTEPLVVSGETPIRTVLKALGIELDLEGVTTTTGFVQQQSGRIPRAGDAFKIAGYEWTVRDDADDKCEIVVTPLDDLNESPS